MDVETIRRAVEPPLADLGLDLDAVEITPAGKRQLLRLAVDADGGVDLDRIAEATRAVDTALEDPAVTGNKPFTLEVTSRGVDRPLTLPRHWHRNRTRLVKVRRVAGSEPTDLVGRIVAAGETSVTLDVDGESAELPYAEIDKALVQVELNRPDAGTTSEGD